MRALLAWWRARHDTDDDTGTTLMEVVVAMTIMGIFLGIFTTAVYQMSRTVNKVEAITTSSGQLNQAFLTLDRVVRYSSAITTAGMSATSGDWYIEMENTANGADVCTQLRIDKTLGQLQQRTWTITNGVAGTASNWKMLANGVTNGNAAAGTDDQPFKPPAGASATSPFQQLTLTLVVESGPQTPTTARSQMTYTALNSVASAASNSTRCQQKGRP